MLENLPPGKYIVDPANGVILHADSREPVSLVAEQQRTIADMLDKAVKAEQSRLLAEARKVWKNLKKPPQKKFMFWASEADRLFNRKPMELRIRYDKRSYRAGYLAAKSEHWVKKHNKKKPGKVSGD